MPDEFAGTQGGCDGEVGDKTGSRPALHPFLSTAVH